ncbi:TetR/AcrR family transcriptional regulator [Amycolatopsis cihanbeyliensis]|uniref:TetR family transcriptional regulator n=1 Tax=Amycolatopsis cihanbeyliensis TaxID=1128664 RepID=A0A542DIC9_AMYCI|nr:TetR/AcrR family transcriptional regulator [Amycolatopsis cihanbeyliensis]TQJ02852.1 TetR family transcriptional regulator [Amycolatopsis cihanbeyliensis]
MPRRTDTRQRMLDTAAALFRTKGYHATGLNQLVSAGGAPKGSVYFHFPGGKEQLATEALDAAARHLCERLREIFTGTASTAEAIDTVVETLGAELLASDFQRGCPLATVALEATDSEPIRQSCAAGYLSWQEVVTDHLAGQGIDRERASSLAGVAIAGIEGGLLLARTQRDLEPLRTVGRHLRATLDKEFS